MNLLRKIKNYFALKSLIVDESVAPIAQTPTEAIDVREMQAKKRARENFKKQETQVMDQFCAPHDINCDFPITPCKQIPCFVHESDKIVKKTKVKKVGKKFVEIE